MGLSAQRRWLFVSGCWAVYRRLLVSVKRATHVQKLDNREKYNWILFGLTKKIAFKPTCPLDN